ncbi:lasso peptide biosynthesis B2 protein [Pigmentiphaga humi]|nr:lasso peptide biosynthesis B2 protein [Pigmentiphaga humi]
MQRIRIAITERNFTDLQAEDAWAWRLTGWLFGVLPDGHSLRRLLGLEYTRHKMQKAVLETAFAELRQCWNASDMRYYAFKGGVFQHAYPDRLMRSHGDIDLYVPPESLPEAVSRLPAGWAFVPAPPDSKSHNAGTLLNGQGRKIADIHRSLMPLGSMNARRSKALHAALEAHSMELAVDGAPSIPAFDWTGQVLAGLVINRGWCGDHWRLKASDYLDLQVLLESGRVTMDGLRRRAAVLGLRHSLEAFLSICDPARQRLVLEHTVRSRLLARLLLDRAAMRDGYFPRYYLGKAVGLLRDLVLFAPILLDVLGSLRRHSNPHDVVRGLKRRRGMHWDELRYLSAARWSTALVRKARITQAGACVIRSLAVLAALRNDGRRATWVQGFRKTPTDGGLPGHAWVEVEGRILDGHDDPNVHAHFTVSLRIEADPEPGSADSR